MAAYPDVKVYVDLVANAFAPATTWTDITQWVYSLDMSYGRSSLLDEFQPGRGVAVLNNNDGRFDPFKVTGPYYPNLKPRRRIKVEATISDPAWSDTFGDATIDPALWAIVGSGGVAETGGNVVLTSATTATTRGVEALEVTPFYDLQVTANSVAMSVTPWPASASFRPVYVRMDVPDSEAAWWGIDGDGFLRAEYKWLAGDITVYVITHSNTTHAHLRIRRIGHTTYWQTSTDGAAWTTRYSKDIPWTTADTCVVLAVVVTTGAEGTTDTCSISALEATYSATHPLAYGWVAGWPQAQPGRKVNNVDLEWSDALTLLARTDLPASVYDYQVRENSPVAWYKLADSTPVLEDSSGHDQHGVWGVFEERQTPYFGLEDRTLPASILKAGKADSVVPMSGRPGMNWAKLQAEVGQPLGGTTDTYRTPVARLGWVSQTAIVPAWTIEMWVLFRQAFPLDVTNTVGSSPVEIVTPLLTWGEPRFGLANANFWRLFYLGGLLRFAVENTTGAGGINSGIAGDLLGQAVPHQVAVRWTGAAMDVLVDGVYHMSVTPGAVNPMPIYRAVVGHAHDNATTSGEEASLQSTIGDVVIYYDDLSDAALLALYRAGRYGSLDATTRLTTGGVVSQALTMIGWTGTTAVNPAGHYCAPDIPNGSACLEYVRKAVKSERGAFWQRPDGTLTFLLSDWSVTLPRAAGAHWMVSDSGSNLLGYSQLDFAYDDDALINEATVGWADGEQRAEDTASRDTFGKLRDNFDTILDNPEDARQLANWMVANYAQPRRVVSRPMVVEPVDTADFSFVCGVEFGSRVSVARTTADGRPIFTDLWVQAVRHRIEPGRLAWQTQLTLEPADDPAPLFRLDSAGTTDGSWLDSTAVLAF